jgi:hypothetical protein
MKAGVAKKVWEYEKDECERQNDLLNNGRPAICCGHVVNLFYV